MSSDASLATRPRQGSRFPVLVLVVDGLGFRPAGGMDGRDLVVSKTPLTDRGVTIAARDRKLVTGCAARSRGSALARRSSGRSPVVVVGRSERLERARRLGKGEEPTVELRASPSSSGGRGGTLWTEGLSWRQPPRRRRSAPNMCMLGPLQVDASVPGRSPNQLTGRVGLRSSGPVRAGRSPMGVGSSGDRGQRLAASNRRAFCLAMQWIQGERRNSGWLALCSPDGEAELVREGAE